LDGAPPLPICRDTIHVSLIDDFRTGRGITRVPITVFDQATEDGCGEILLILARRLDSKFLCGTEPLTFIGTEYLEFCCEDIGKFIPVSLTFFDNFGNTSSCESAILIEDKSVTQIVCKELTFDCDAKVDEMILYEAIYSKSKVCNSQDLISFGPINGPEACGNSTELVPVYLNGDWKCNIKINYNSPDTFNPYSIKWPVHYDGRKVKGISRECEINTVEGHPTIGNFSGEVVHPSYFECAAEEVLAVPVWCNTSCGLVGMSYELDTLSASDACYILVKKWTVIDWCSYIPNQYLSNQSSDLFEIVDDTWLDAYNDTLRGTWLSDSKLSDQDCISCAHSSGVAGPVYYRYNRVKVDGYYQYDQLIKVLDRTPPVIEVIMADTILIEQSVTKSGSMEMDACAEGSLISAFLTDLCTTTDQAQKSFGTWWIEHTIFDENYNVVEQKNYSGYDSSFTIELNEVSRNWTQQIIWTARDACGNTAVDTSTIIFVDRTPPVPVCISSLSTITLAEGEVIIWATDFDLGSFDNCSEDLEFAISVDRDMAEWSHSIGLNCIDFQNTNGTQTLRIHVRDEAGNSDYCIVNVRIDLDRSCKIEESARASISGDAHTQYGDMIEKAIVSLTTLELDTLTHGTVLTDIQGQYSFASNPMYVAYAIHAHKNDDPLNGVTALDLILMQKHVLGIEALPDDFSLVAADINADGKISAVDLVELRKVMLGVYSEFPSNDSWRFIPDQKNIGDNLWPNIENNEIHLMLDKTMTEQNFIGIKIGDVSGNARANSLSTSKVRSAKTISLVMEAPIIDVRGEAEILIKSTVPIDLQAIQFALNLNKVNAVSITSGELEIDSLNYYVFPDKRRVSFIWHDTKGIGISINQASNHLFTIKIIGTSRVMPQDLMAISLDGLKAMAYDREGEEYAINWILEGVKDLKFEIFQNAPNPFALSTKIPFTIPQSGLTTFTIFDLMGNTVHQENDFFPKGYNEIIFRPTTEMPEGLYYYQIESGDEVATSKMILLR
jgi:hypothetical protein